VWEAATGLDGSPFTARGRIFSVTFSRDGQWIVTAGDDQTARVWDAGHRHELSTVKRHGSRISSVAFSRDSQRVVTGGGSVSFSPNGEVINPDSGDQTAKVWTVSNDPELLTLKGHSDAIGSVAFSPDGRWIVPPVLTKRRRCGRPLLANAI
jgi:WD40 repeat protein